MYRIIINLVLIICLIFITSCNSKKTKMDVQGHRGCRGVYPENTLLAFEKAIDYGVTTLEMDVVISKDKKVVVSHEPYFSHEISTDQNGNEITPKNEKLHNIYKLNYDTIIMYDVGLKKHKRFLEQHKTKAVKPLLTEVISTIENKVKKENTKKPFYNIEIKRNPAYDSIFHPNVNEFVHLVLEVVNNSNIKNRICIQSFDIESLQLVNQIDPSLTTALLIENKLPFKKNLENLGFTPSIYSPDFTLVNEDLVKYCKNNNIRLIPWTVNEVSDILKMIDFNVDGIITDYPTRLITQLHKSGLEIK